MINRAYQIKLRQPKKSEYSRKIFPPAKSGRVFEDIVVGIAVVVKGLFFCLTRIFIRPALPDVSGFEPRPRLLITSF